MSTLLQRLTKTYGKLSCAYSDYNSLSRIRVLPYFGYSIHNSILKYL